MRRLTIRAQLDSHSGYGLLVCETFKWMTKRGIYVTLRPTGINEQWGSMIPKEMTANVVKSRQPETWELLIYPPTLPPTPERKTVHFCMWESTVLGPANVDLLDRCETVIVPSKWCAESFKKSGFKRPIQVVPLGYDPEIFRPTPIPEHGPTVFGIAGRVAHCPKRKMIQEAVDLFIATFKGDEDVRLHVKIHPDDKLTDPKDKRVKIFRDVFEPYQLANWLHGLTFYMTLARAEGYGLWPLQALACGRPVIGCNYSGQADFLNAKNGILVPFKEIACDGHGDSNVAYEGQWAQPDMRQAGVIMRMVERTRAVAIANGAAAATSVEYLTWEKSTDKLIKILERVGVWK